MTVQPLFYRSVVPLNRETHRRLGLSLDAPYKFAESSHLVPALVDEFSAACAGLPILFAVDPAGMSPVFLTSGMPGRDVLIAEDGSWSGRYIPAYLRRFPFILGEVPGAQPLICFDEKADLVQPETAGRPVARFFNEDGSETQALLDRIKFVTDFAESAKRTQAFCKQLQDLKLLHPITIQNTKAGAASAIHGLLAVSEALLNELPDADFLALRKTGALAAVHMHLVSLHAIDRLPAA